MADDTPTVELATERLYDYLRTSQDKREGKVDPDLRRDVDALIARVRAEPPLTDDEQTPTTFDLISALQRAHALCVALRAYPEPRVESEGGGAIGLDWDEGAQRVLSITIDMRPEIGYAYLVGESRAHGRVAYGSAVSMIEEVLRLIYPEVVAQTGAPSRQEEP